MALVANPQPVTPAEQLLHDELAALRGQNVTMARELGILRWQLAKLLEQQSAVRAGASRAQSTLWRRFPRAVERLARWKRIVSTRAKQHSSAAMPHLPRASSVRLDRQLRLDTPILLAAEGTKADRIAAVAPSGVMRVVPGAGLTANLPFPPSSVPTLQAATPDSLAVFLVADALRLRKFRTIVVDEGDAISLSLLQGRMVQGQSLLVLRGTGERSATVQLHNPDADSTEYALYTRLPGDWLDPLDEQARPTTPLVARCWPKISVVMVSFNQADFLEEGLRSVLDQEYPNLEFIVIDGQSKDRSIEILERYCDRLSLLVIEPDKGQSDGLNKGFARATGDILTWVNSDDLLEPGALFRVAQAYRAHGVDMVAGGCRQIGLARSQVIHNHHTKLPYGVALPLPLGLLLEMDRFWLNSCFFYQPEVFFSRDIWLRSGGRLRTDLNYVLDYDLWVRMAAAGATIVHIPDFLACSRTHDQQKTTIGMPYLPEVQRLLREYYARLVSPSAPVYRSGEVS
jgi:hypothetical protein